MSTVNLSKTTVNLSKKQVVNLSKQSEGLKKVTVALGWDEAKARTEIVERVVKPGLIGKLLGRQERVEQVEITRDKEYEYDLDAWVAFMKDGVIKSKSAVIYYGHKDMDNNGKNFVHHCGDNLTGEGDGDDEQIVIDLSNVPSEYNGIVVGVTIYEGRDRNQKFGDIENFFVRVVDNKDDFEICRYADSVSEEYRNCLTFIVGKLYLDKGEWQFMAEGYGTHDKSIGDAVNNYKG